MFDLLIKQATLIDGSGAPGRIGDLAVKDGSIAALAPTIDAKAQEEIDGKGAVLCPGFIDPHSHWDVTHLNGKQAEVKLRQGVCLDLVGNCGESLMPCSEKSITGLCQLFPGSENQVHTRDFATYREEIDRAAPGLRVMSHVGHGALRINAMGHQGGKPTEQQLKQMQSELAEALDEGGAGLSTGLYYTPSGYAEDEELIALLKIVADKKRFHASHIRNEAGGIFDALDEIIRCGIAAGAATHVSHLKLAGKQNWSEADKVIERFEKARQNGLDLTCDVYPYHHSCTTLLALIPPWALVGGVPGLTKRIADSQLRKKIQQEMINGAPGWESSVQNAGFEGITISSIHTGERKELEGTTLAAAALDAGLAPADFVLDLIEEHNGAISIICASMNEEVVSEFIKLPYAMIGSDGALSDGKPHPRAYGAFPRVIRRFVRELGVLSLEEAIHKMTGLTASRLQLSDCGLLEPGRRADLVLFDPQIFGDQATFNEPRQYATGLHKVFLGGKQAWPKPALPNEMTGGFLAASNQ